MRSAAASAAEYFPKLEAGLRLCSSLLRRGRDAEAIRVLAEAIDGLTRFGEMVDAMARTSTLRLDRARKLQVEFSTALKGAVDAWEHGDYVLLADLLVYEVAPVLRKGREWLLSAEVSDCAAESGKRAEVKVAQSREMKES